MCPACLRGAMTAGPDVVRRPDPYQNRGLEALDPQTGSPIYSSTASHHAIITPASARSCRNRRV